MQFSVLTFAGNLRAKPLHGAVVQETFGGGKAFGEVALFTRVLQRVVHFEPREGLDRIVACVGDEGRVGTIH